VIGLDTNVLVRYLTQDDVAQARKANALMTDLLSKGERCFIGSVVLCEVVWVLRGAYGFDKATIVSVLEKLLATGQFTFQDKDLARRAILDYRTGRGDWADYLIGRQAEDAGCGFTATFDRRLHNCPLFQTLA
jgi:predicted nucleic-acid-binding protein